MKNKVIMNVRPFGRLGPIYPVTPLLIVDYVLQIENNMTNESRLRSKYLMSREIAQRKIHLLQLINAIGIDEK